MLCRPEPLLEGVPSSKVRRTPADLLGQRCHYVAGLLLGVGYGETEMACLILGVQLDGRGGDYFWPGDRDVRSPAFYSYTAPDPDGLTDQPLEPEATFWAPEGGMALLMYDDLRKAGSPKDALLEFLESAYRAGARTAGWDVEELRAVPAVLIPQISRRDSSRSRSRSMRCMASSPIRPSLRSSIRVLRCARSSSLMKRW
jgi:hypothetical protein